MVPVLYFTLFYPGPAHLLVILLAMGTIGVLLTGLRNMWALLIGLGSLPATWQSALIRRCRRRAHRCTRPPVPLVLPYGGFQSAQAQRGVAGAAPNDVAAKALDEGPVVEVEDLVHRETLVVHPLHDQGRRSILMVSPWPVKLRSSIPPSPSP